jgi:hypothetical protein
MNVGEVHGDELRQPLLITAAELAKLLQVSTRTLWRLRSAGERQALNLPCRIARSKNGHRSRAGMSCLHVRPESPWTFGLDNSHGGAFLTRSG